jgi:hypothetical protein
MVAEKMLEFWKRAFEVERIRAGGWLSDRLLSAMIWVFDLIKGVSS